ncbi:hypothetical protein [Aureibacter tunicatorum]|uniref:Uncharacterized protein n=1 Tax=Aureibacter tunicatorum TaxID=866807 RepID=A0AAE3XTV2_9BACT|nr:hypothetical protein [Aureibacter tunicatorum]MDR6241890.1 hypothetical protein [Aureibacter tunicatorum]BDD07497.1 hypothetical protein AUTU_49800 [Aureibacter tunicatorum]
MNNKSNEIKKDAEKVYEIQVPRSSQEGDVATGFLKKPSRKVLAAFLSKVGADPLGAYELLLKNCWMHGDEEILNDDELLLGACSALEPLVSFRQGVLKKI